MKDSVLIKSYPNGISLRLEAEMPLQQILAEIGYKFAEAKSFFGKAATALSIEGRQVS